MKLFTVGHTKKSLRRFVELLRNAEVDAVIDIRLNTSSQLMGYAKAEDLSFVLETLGISYLHLPELAPTKELLQRYRGDKDWEAYESEFTELMKERGAASVAREALSRFSQPCLLCSEDKPDKCHRRLVAEIVAAEYPDTEVGHLL